MRSCGPIQAQNGLRTVLEAVADIEGRDSLAPGERRWAPTGWGEIDRAAGGGLRLGAVHEWLWEARERRPADRDAGAPVGLLSHLAAGAIQGHATGGRVLWIGRRCWPSVASLLGNERLLDRSVFVDVGRGAERVWAIDVALRSAGVAVVVADGAGLGMGESRRLQLAAGTGGTLCLLARPGGEAGEISAAWTRWRVAPSPSPDASPRWTVELLRCKGLRPTDEDARRWVVRRDHEAGVVSLAPDVPDRSAPTFRPAVRYA